MTSTFRKSFLFALVLSLIFGLASCGGGASNNDQGTSFLAYGYFQPEEPDDLGGDRVGVTGLILPLFTDTARIPDVYGIWADGLLAAVEMGIENRLSQQFIRVDRIDCDYDIQGSELNVPSDSHSASYVLGPRVILEDGSGGSTADEEAPDANKVYASFEVISPDIYSFLAVNQAYLPALPFRMTAVCRATGVTQAGDVLTTNRLHLLIQFVDEAEFEGVGTRPFEEGEAAGGDFIPGGSGDGEEEATAESDVESAGDSDVDTSDFVIE